MIDIVVLGGLVMLAVAAFVLIAMSRWPRARRSDRQRSETETSVP